MCQVHNYFTVKVDIDISRHKVGDTITAAVKLEVIGIQQRAGQGSNGEASLELQITDIDLGDEGKPAKGKFATYKSVQDEGPTQEG